MHQTAFFRTSGGPKEGQHGVKMLLGNNSRETAEIKKRCTNFPSGLHFPGQIHIEVGQVVLPSVSGSS